MVCEPLVEGGAGTAGQRSRQACSVQPPQRGLRPALAGLQGSGERIGSDGEAPFLGSTPKRPRLPSGAGDDWGAGGSEQPAAAAEDGAAYEPWELPLLELMDSSRRGGIVSEAFLRQQQRVFAEVRRGGGGGSSATQRQHAAIFGLAAALLEGPAQQ